MFQCHTFFPSQDIKKNVTIKFLCRQLMTSSTLRLIFDQTLQEWLTGGKDAETEIEKFEYLENEKSFLGRS